MGTNTERRNTMEQIPLDTGVAAFRLGEGGVLRMNPRDPGLYARFLEAEEKFQEALKEVSSVEQGSLALLRALDRRFKEILNYVFGAPNDFDEILGGVSLLTVTENGRFLLENLFAALEPVLVQGAKDCAAHQVERARIRKEGVS